MQGLLLVGGCGLLLILARLASGPVLALMRRLSPEDPIAVTAFWVSSGVVLLGAPLAGWWADQAGRRASMAVGAAILAAALTLLMFLHGHAWVVLYALVAFGVVLTGLAATTCVALELRRFALATVIAFCLPYVRLTPAVPPGMMGLLQSGERSFALLGIGFAIAAALPLSAIGVSYAMGLRRPRAGDAGAGDTAVPDLSAGPPFDADAHAAHAASGAAPPEAFAARARFDPNPALVLIAITGWLTQIGPVATDLVQGLRQDEMQRSAMPLVGIVLAGVMAYVWAIVADVLTPRPGRPGAGVRPAQWLTAGFSIFALGVALVLLARGTTLFSLGMFVASAGAAGIVPIAVAGQLRAVSASGWGHAIGLSMGAFVFGQMAGAQVNLYLAAWLGVPAALGTSALAAVLVVFWLTRRPAPPADDPPAVSNAVAA